MCLYDRAREKLQAAEAAHSAQRKEAKGVLHPSALLRSSSIATKNILTKKLAAKGLSFST
jgi:hypothetical protein